MFLTSLLAKFRYPYPVQTSAEYDQEELLQYIEFLMRQYSFKKSFYLANCIVQKLEILRDEMDRNPGRVTEWECQRLLRKWRYLAAQRSWCAGRCKREKTG